VNRRSANDRQLRGNGGSVVVRLVLWVALVGVVAGAGHWAWGWVQRPDVMPLTRVAVDGKMTHLRRDQLEAVVTLAAWGNYLTVDIERVRAAAVSLPWVARASVRRVWPDALVIHVEEREPFARWGEEALISREGEIFRPESLEGVDALPLLEAQDDRGPEMIRRFKELQTVVGGVGLGLQHLKRDERGAWSLWLDNGTEIVLGKEDTDSRLHRVVWLLGRLGEDRGRLERVDVRYANGMAVRWKPAEEHSPDAQAAG